MALSKPSETQLIEKPGSNPTQATIPAFGITDKELPDSLRPEVVDMEVVERLGEIDSAATSDGSGISGNVRPGSKDRAASAHKLD
jgi:hypothetical protein